MLKLLESSTVVELPSREPPATPARARVDRVDGDPDLADMLDAVRALLGVESIAMHLVASDGGFGRLLAGVGPDGFGGWPDGFVDRLTPGQPGRWTPGDASSGPVHVSLIAPRARDRIALLCRPDESGAGDRRALAGQVARYLPLIERAVAQWARAHVEAMRGRERTAMLDALGCALVVLDADARIHTDNAAARAQLERSGTISATNGRLVIHHLEDAMRLQVSLQHVLSGGGTITTAVRRGARAPLLLVLSPAGGDGGGGAARFATVQIVDPDAELTLPLDTLARHWDLTQAERRLVEQLVRGRTLGEAAAALRLKEQTARTYLKHVFQKTGLRRQVELIRLVLAGAVPRCLA